MWSNIRDTASSFVNTFFRDSLSNNELLFVLFSQMGHILKAGLDPGPWTLDSGLWTLIFFFLSKLYPPPKKNLYFPPEKPLYLPHETPPSPHKHFFPQILCACFQTNNVIPPPTSPKKPLCLPLKTAPSQKTPSPPPNKKYNYIGID